MCCECFHTRLEAPGLVELSEEENQSKGELVNGCFCTETSVITRSIPNFDQQAALLEKVTQGPVCKKAPSVQAAGVNAHLHSSVENAAADLNHLQVLLLFIPGALDVRHPAALVLLAGVDEVAHRSVFVEHLCANNNEENRVSTESVWIK